MLISISHRSLKEIGYSGRRPDQVPLLSAKNRELRLQIAQALQNLTVEKNHLVWWVSISAVTFGWLGDNLVWMWNHGSILYQQFRLVVYTHWCGRYSLARFGPLSTNWASFKRHSTVAHWNNDADRFNLIGMNTSCDGYFQKDNTQCEKAWIISNWFIKHHTVLKWPPVSSSQAHKAFFGCDGIGDSH